MLKKAMLGILAVALLAGTESLFAQGRKARPKAGQKQKQVQKGLQPGQQGLDRWLAALTKAYRENDSEKMGQLLRNMNQRRRKQKAQKGKAEGRLGQLRKVKEGPGKDRKDLWGGHRKGKGHPEEFREREHGRRWHGRGFEREGKGRHHGAFRREGRGERCRAFRGEGRRKDTKGFRGEGMRRRGRRFQGRGRRGQFRDNGDGLDKWEHGWRHRGMSRWGRGFHSRGQGKQYWDEHQEHLPDHSGHKSDFDWDW